MTIKRCALCSTLLPDDDTSGRCDFHQPDAIAARRASQSARAAEFAAIREKHGLTSPMQTPPKAE